MKYLQNTFGRIVVDLVAIGLFIFLLALTLNLLQGTI